jgi:hypothetical protein
MQEKTVNQFIKEMDAAGITGNFVATNGEQTYKGTINKDGTIKTIKVQTVNESRRKIRELLNEQR